MPLTIPLDEPIVATAVFVLIHVPVVIESVNAEVPPRQTFADPMIGPGIWFTVTVCVMVHTAV